MKSKADTPLIFVSSLPDGTFNGKWSGYSVRFSIDNVEYSAKTDVGIRGLNVPCAVTVKDNKIEVDSDIFGSNPKLAQDSVLKTPNP